MKRQFDKIISKGTGSQLLWLTVLCALLFCLFFAIGTVVYGDLPWQEVTALLLDPGCFGGEGHHDVFRLLIALAGCFTFSALLVSVFSNIIDNLSDDWHKGNVRYRCHDHIVILGAHRHLFSMLREADRLPDGNIVIMTSGDVEQLRGEIAMQGLDKHVVDRIILYNGRRDIEQDVRSIYPQKAKMVYVLGEDNEKNHDSLSLRCLELLKKESSAMKGKLPVYVLLTDYTTMEVISRHTATGLEDNLHVDFVNAHEYQAEQFFAYSDFLPVIKRDEKRTLNLVVIGISDMTRAIASTIANVAHYPNFSVCGGRTRISVVAENMVGWASDFIASYEGLFRLSRWTLMDANGCVMASHVPDEADGDYLDVEWCFVDGTATCSVLGNLIGDAEYSRIVVSEENDEKSLRTLLHLPARFHNVKKVIYQEQCADLLKLARQTGKYGMIASFGSGVGKADAMFFNRMGYGKVVNRFYDLQYNKPQAQDAESAWYKIPEAHKLSSIYCAMALPLRLECISADDDVMAVCEVEHRRWMMSCLLMGYMPFSLSESRRVRADKQRFKEEKRHYRHADIAPFSSLDDFEKRKDLLFVEHTRKIINVERTKIDWHIKPEPSCL